MISTCSIAINETGRDSCIPIDLISSSGYNWVSKDKNRSGGGFEFFARDTINFQVRPDLNNSDIDILRTEIIKNKSKPFLITTWYGSPNDPMETLHKFENCLKSIDNKNKESTIL